MARTWRVVATLLTAVVMALGAAGCSSPATEEEASTRAPVEESDVAPIDDDRSSEADDHARPATVQSFDTLPTAEAKKTATYEAAATTESEKVPDTEISFGSGWPYQVIAAAGPREVLFVAEGTSLEAVDLAVHSIDADGFLELATGPSGRRNRVLELIDGADTKKWGFDLDHPVHHYEGGRQYKAALPRSVEPGTYVLTVSFPSDPDGPADVLPILLAKDLLLAHNNDGELAVWAHNPGHEHVGSLQVRVFDQAGSTAAKGRTDDHGVYRVDVGPGRELPFSAVVFRDNQPSGMISIRPTAETGSPTSHTVNWLAPRPGRYGIHVHLDRPVYRPGDVARFRVYALRAKDVGYDPVPAGTTINVSLGDLDEPIAGLTADNWGSVEGTFELSALDLDDADSGTILKISIEGELHRWPLKIRHEPQAIDGTMALSTDRDTYAEGDPITLNVDYVDNEGLPIADPQLALTMYGRHENDGWFEFFPEERWQQSTSDGRISFANEVHLGDGRHYEWGDESAGGPTLHRMVGAIFTGGLPSAVGPTAAVEGFSVLSAGDEPVWDERPFSTVLHGNLRIASEQSEYSSGDTAVLFVEPAVKGPCWLTVARMGVYRSTIVELDESGRFELPLTEADAPNAFVALSCRHPADPEKADAATTEIKVRAIHPRLDVSLLTDCAHCAAGQAARIIATVMDEAGRPVAARLQMSMADSWAHVLDGRRPRTTEVSLFAPRGYTNDTHVDASNRSFGFEIEPICCGAGPSLHNEPAIRFNSDVGWWSGLGTDQDGVATVPVTLPKTPADWRFHATAITDDGRLGEASLVVGTSD